jgi:hypothetical protein
MHQKPSNPTPPLSINFIAPWYTNRQSQSAQKKSTLEMARVIKSKDKTTLQNTVICKGAFSLVLTTSIEPNMRPENTNDFANRR